MHLVNELTIQWAIDDPRMNPDTGEAATRKANPAVKFPSP
jgi:hypothetical protein